MNFYILSNYERCGDPRSDARNAVIAVLERAGSPEGRTNARRRRASWIKDARAEFKEFVRQKPEPCAVCRKYIQFVHAHHSFRSRRNLGAVSPHLFTITSGYARSITNMCMSSCRAVLDRVISRFLTAFRTKTRKSGSLLRRAREKASSFAARLDLAETKDVRMYSTMEGAQKFAKNLSGC